MMRHMDAQAQSTVITDVPLVPPSTLLPPIRKALDLSSDEICRFVVELARIYTPEVLGTRFEVVTPARPTLVKRKKATKGQGGTLSVPIVDSGYASLVASDDEDEGDDEAQQSIALKDAVQNLAHHLSEAKQRDIPDEQLALLRADEFERSYAMKWLTGLISRSEEWTDLGADDDQSAVATMSQATSESSVQPVEQRSREQVIEKVSALLAACAGSSASGALTRSFTYHPNFSRLEAGREMHQERIEIHLKDDSLPAQDHTAVGLQTWGSAPILAQMIAERPAKYGLDLEARFGVTGVESPWGHKRDFPSTFKVLELGAGTGLLSLFTWRLFEQQILRSQVRRNGPTLPQCSVLATDFHPSVLSNLNFNLNLNPPSSGLLDHPLHTPPSIETQFLDWNSCVPLEEDERFDVVYGADVIYEKEHAHLIKSVVENVLKRPSILSQGRDGDGTVGYTSGGVFWLIYPLRPTHEVETESIGRAFGEVVDFSQWPENMEASANGQRNLRDWALGVLGLQCLERKKGIGRADEVSYRVLKIGWVGA